VTGYFMTEQSEIAIPVFLPMYDWPEVREATRAIEAALQAELSMRLAHVEFQTEARTEQGLFDRWQDPALLLSQTCGFPLVTALAGRVEPVLTPHYAVEGCSGANYSSVLLVPVDSHVAKLEDATGARAVLNGWDSQSGFNTLRHALMQLPENGPFFESVQVSGSHLASMQYVAQGHADICCIDAVCWALTRSYRPDLSDRLKPVGRTASVPGLPWVTSSSRSPDDLDAIRDAAVSVFEDSGLADARAALFLDGYSFLDFADYAPILQMKTEGERGSRL